MDNGGLQLSFHYNLYVFDLQIINKFAEENILQGMNLGLILMPFGNRLTN